MSPSLLALIASVELEIEPLRRRLHDMRDLRVGRKPAFSGTLAGQRVLLLQGGIGKSNAAQMLAAALENFPVRGVIAFGVGGAFAGSGLEVGDVGLATAEIYGDEGVESPSGWLSTEEIGIPLLEAPTGSCFNAFPLPSDRVAGASASLLDAGIVHRAGRFVTVSCCSGTASRGSALRNRFEALVESMEGAAYAHVAALYEVPFIEVRGISNRVEDRDLKRWELAPAAEIAARGVEQIVAGW